MKMLLAVIGNVKDRKGKLVFSMFKDLLKVGVVGTMILFLQGTAKLLGKDLIRRTEVLLNKS